MVYFSYRWTKELAADIVQNKAMKLYSLCLLVLVAAPLFSPAQYRPHLLVLTDATVIDANHREPALHQTVVIKDGRIAGIQPGTMTFPDSAVIIKIQL